MGFNGYVTLCIYIYTFFGGIVVIFSNLIDKLMNDIYSSLPVGTKKDNPG